MNATPIRNDFMKAMGQTILIANASLADARRFIDTAGLFRRNKARRQLALAIEFCRLLIQPVNDCEHDAWKTPEFAEAYCRKHLPLTTEFCRRAMASHGYESPECQRLTYMAGIIEENLNKYLDKETADICLFGDSLPLVREMEKHGQIGLNGAAQPRNILRSINRQPPKQIVSKV
jgi:hypothetical protein